MKTLALTVVKDPVEEINQLHADICLAARGTIEAAIRIGELLTEERKALKYGEWLKWLKGNIQFSQRTAYRYVRTYKHRSKFATVANLADAYRISLPKQKRKLKEAKAITPEQASKLWLRLLDKLPEIQRPAVARAAARWTSKNHVLLGDIDIKYNQAKTVNITF
jgi:Protein of unknown function (DUF3102)